MAYALVGFRGNVSQSGLGSAVTPVWPVNEPRTANHRLICWCSVSGSATLPTTPSGWSIAKQIAGTNCSATVYHKTATGGDAAPTIAGITNAIIYAQLAEFSGGDTTASPVDSSGSATGTTSPKTATDGSIDVLAGELVIYAAAENYSLNAVATNSVTLNNGAASHDTTNADGSTNTYTFYNMGYGVTTGNSAADAATLTFTTTSIAGTALAVASFKLPNTPYNDARSGTIILSGSSTESRVANDSRTGALILLGTASGAVFADMMSGSLLLSGSSVESYFTPPSLVIITGTQPTIAKLAGAVVTNVALTGKPIN